MRDEGDPNGDLGVDPTQQLVSAFHERLDEALIRAISSDYDLLSSGYQDAFALLQDLADNAAPEEASGFNSAGLPPESSLQDDQTTVSTYTETSADFSVSNSSSSGAENTMPESYVTAFDGQSEAVKAEQLQSMFKDIKNYDILHSLRKAKGNFQIAVDDLLNIQYLVATGQRMKGIDGFFDTDEGDVTNKEKRNMECGTETSEGNSVSHLQKVTLKNSEDIEYFAQRLHIPYDEVSDIYFRNSCARVETLIELLEKYPSNTKEPFEEVEKECAKRIKTKFRHIQHIHAMTLIQLTNSSPQYVDDLGTMLNKYFARKPKSVKLAVDYRTQPPAGESLENTSGRVHRNRLSQGIDVGGTRAPSIRSGREPLSWEGAVSLSDNHKQKRQDAQSSSASLLRRGASSPLYRQAAGYYAECAREHTRYAQEASSVAADLFVNRQSDAYTIDLHGVSVLDGVRIALSKSHNWWKNLGDFKSSKAKRHTLTIITGIGRHSAGGFSRLRQQVAAALVQDGWKFEVETGKFVVNGRR